MKHKRSISRPRENAANHRRYPALAKADPVCFVKNLFSGGGNFDCGSTPLLAAFLSFLRSLGLVE